jgi:DNA-directed DNA polymerase III PolC
MAGKDKSFVHLHSHSQYSMLDGAAGVDPLLEAVASEGMPAIAVTDHGSMAGTYDFWKAAKRHGVKFIPGVEIYLSPRVPRDHRAPVKWNNGGEDDVSGAGAYTHLTLLAESTLGMHNLFKISSEAFLTGLYRKPRADHALLAEHAAGVIATTGCPSGEIQTWLRIGDYAEARATAGRLLDIFGHGNLYVELMDHDLGIERRVADGLLRLGKDLGIPFVATNDLHYVHRQDATTHEALLCVQSGSTLDDPKRFKFDSDTFYLRSAAEMRALFDTTVPGACDNTLLIAERCEATFPEGGNLMPIFPTPDGHDEASWLAHEVNAGLEHRYPAGIPEDRTRRAEYEMDVINQMGFPSYFLVVADFIRWAKDNGIRVGPGRGSAAGSIVAYALGITDLDPIRHGLLFERFLNPERVSMPDIDIDFDEHRRSEVIEYVINKYGAEKVAAITTIMQVKAKAAIKDAARVLGYPYGLGDQITKTYPQPVVGRDLPLSGAFDKSNERYNEAAEFRDLVASNKDVAKVVELARGLEGSKRGHGMHAAGIIMSRDPLVEHIPLMRRDPTSPVMTAFEYPTCESLGLLKMDFLGLSNLTTIDEAIRQIQRNRGLLTVDLHGISESLDDPGTYRLLASGDTLGVFQLDSAPIRSLLRLINPDRFEDISAVLALYRPGPMGAGAHLDYADRKNGRKPVVPIHPELGEPLAEILSDTYGLIVYQEQVMAIAQAVAGYSLGQADLLRRAMGKKKKEILDKEFAPFAAAMTERGYSQEAIKTLWDVLVPFSDYAFNRCVDGDTLVSLGAAGSSSDGTATVRSLHDRLHLNLLPARRRGEPITYEGPCLHCQREDRPAVWRGRCRACKSWITKFRNTGLTALALDTDGRVRPKRIKDVHYNGTRACYTITLADGRSITATENHRHMTASGWRRVDEIRIGDRLLVATPDTTSVHHKYDYRLTAERPTYRAARLSASERHGENSLGWVNGASVALAEWTRNQEKVCTQPGCGRSAASGDRIERAHLDGNRRNNTPENLRMLCVSHHKQWDYAHNGRARRWEAGHLAVPVEIVSIEYAGEREVYDLEMDDPGHNWVGNGIITHNSHSAGYGIISYLTAYLKANFPAEYMAALLTTNAQDKDKLAIYLGECRRMGIKVLPPDVNESSENFTAVGQDIRVGLVGVKNVGHGVVESILATREQHGAFRDFSDFLNSCDASSIRKKAVESLIKAGAFDSFRHPRRALFDIHERAIDAAVSAKKHIAAGQDSLFAGLDDDPADTFMRIPDVPEWTKEQLLAFEREMIGLYVSDHPLSDIHHLLPRLGTTTTIAGILASDFQSGVSVRIAGCLVSVERKTTKRGDLYANTILEDMDGQIAVSVFPRVFETAREHIRADAIVAIDGRVERRDDGSVSITANAIQPVNIIALKDPDSVPLVLHLPEGHLTSKLAAQLKALLSEHPGRTPVQIRVERPSGADTLLALSDDLTVQRDNRLVGELKALLGFAALREG